MEYPAEKLKRAFTFLGVTGAVYGAFRFLLPLVVPFFVGWGLAVFLWPSASRLSRRLRLAVRVRSLRNPGKAGKPGGERLIFIGIPAGVIGAAECLAVLGILGTAAWAFGRILCGELLTLQAQLPGWLEAADGTLTGWCHSAERCFSLKNDCLVLLVREMLRGLLIRAKQNVMPYVMVNSVTAFGCLARAVVFLAVLLMAAGLLLQELVSWRERMDASPFRREFRVICTDLRLAANAYLRTQGILLLLISAACAAVFRLMGNPYYLLAGVGTGVLDALPVFGTCVILIPWAGILFLQRKFGSGVLLLALCAGCYLLRQLLETRMMSRRLGLSAFTEFLAFVVGMELFGLPGLFLGPAGFLLIRDLTALLCGKGQTE